MFDLDLQPGMNVLVGDNDVGKSTVLEAIGLALTGCVGGRRIENELTPYVFNSAEADRYLASVKAGGEIHLPECTIDVYVEESDDFEIFRGSNNMDLKKLPGFQLKISFDHRFDTAHRTFISEPDDVLSIPVEYFKIEWRSFAGDFIARRNVGIKTSFIDTSSMRLQFGFDRFTRDFVVQELKPEEHAEVSRAYRAMRETFTASDEIEKLNESLEDVELFDHDVRTLTLGIDISRRTDWESTIVPHLDGLPFDFVGDGTRSALKMMLALHNTNSPDKSLLLIEEPENHQSPGSLAELMSALAKKLESRQAIVATHSSFVMNRLGLDDLVLLGPDGDSLRLTALDGDTVDFFRRLAGFETLRAVLAKKLVLVEGPSDALIFQRSYRELHDAEAAVDGIAVLAVGGISFKRYLAIAEALNIRTAVVADNDGKSEEEVKARLAVGGNSTIRVFTGKDPDLRSLEQNIVAANDPGDLASTLARGPGSTISDEDWMIANKTEAALRILDSTKSFEIPEYIRDAAGFIHGEQ
jgi:predicted ATPase